MDVKVKKIEGIKGTLTAPPSKSYTHRAFVIASLARGRSVIRNPLLAGDTNSTLDACKAFGAGVETWQNKDVVIDGTGGELKTPERAVDCGNSGTTIRLISGVAALDGEVVLTGDESLQKRPMQPLIDALNQLDVKAVSVKSDGTPPVMIKGGGIRGGDVRIRGDISSQFISSLLIASPYAGEDVKISVTTPLKSRPYVDITLDIMERFGVFVVNDNYEMFKVPASSISGYMAGEYVVEGDFSSASYFMAIAAVTPGSRISIRNLPGHSKQGDRAIVGILKDMGADVDIKENTVVVKGSGGLEGIEIDLKDTPDLLPTVAALALKADGKTVIKNIEHARYKESDRVRSCAEELSKFGVVIKEERDRLTIDGAGSEGRINGAVVLSHGDHRMAMALTVAGLMAEGQTLVRGVECVDISFPGFFDCLNRYLIPDSSISQISSITP